MDKRRRTDTLSYVMLAILFTMFLMVLLAIIKGDVKSEYGALVGGYGTTILGMFAVAVGFLWGSSKGSQLKDEAMNAGTPSTTTTPTGATATVTATSEAKE